jgi:hypothetical protein
MICGECGQEVPGRDGTTLALRTRLAIAEAAVASRDAMLQMQGKAIIRLARLEAALQEISRQEIRCRDAEKMANIADAALKEE